jgi:hypothetical protein
MKKMLPLMKSASVCTGSIVTIAITAAVTTVASKAVVKAIDSCSGLVLRIDLGEGKSCSCSPALSDCFTKNCLLNMQSVATRTYPMTMHTD